MRSLRRILALYRVANFRCSIVRGPDRNLHLEALWELYRTTYATIGMHLTGPHELMDYDLWDLCVDGEDKIRQFTLFKKTSLGLKSGLSGHDGSPEGKRWAVQQLKKRFAEPGVYGEVSHKIKEIVLSLNVPAVCASFVSQVLKKTVKVEGPLEYSRALGDLGNVTKILVGRPRGIPTTLSGSPSCPLEGARVAAAEDEEDAWDRTDLDAHVSCLL